MSKRRTSSRSRGPGRGDMDRERLHTLLEAVVRDADRSAQVAVDPISAVLRYTEPRDQEVAAVFASVLAFGRVAAFRPVVAAILDVADRHGGPHAYVTALDPTRTQPLHPLRYRWMSGEELGVLVRALGRVIRTRGSLERAFVVGPERHDRLASGVDALRKAVLAEQGVSEWRLISRGLRYMLPHPSGGSACKRWCMFLRWMVRPPAPDTVAGLDLGIWSGDVSRLVMPLDTHVLRISRMVGLTRRKDASWRTALDITDHLARIHPADPLRYDFAVAHLGISGGCSGRFVSSVCSICGLRSACRVARQKV